MSSKPAIVDVLPSFDGDVKVAIDPDGNCFCTAWIVGAILHAVQSPRRLGKFFTALDRRVNEFFALLDDEQKVKGRCRLQLCRQERSRLVQG